MNSSKKSQALKVAPNPAIPEADLVFLDLLADIFVDNLIKQVENESHKRQSGDADRTDVPLLNTTLVRS